MGSRKRAWIGNWASIAIADRRDLPNRTEPQGAIAPLHWNERGSLADPKPCVFRGSACPRKSSGRTTDRAGPD
eukprot:9659879-Alexandrium_andersonii.AAC.1